MDELSQKSVEKFTKELKMRINILNSSTTSANLDEDSHNKIEEIISASTHRPMNTLTTIDIVNMKENDIETILEIIGLDKEGIKHILSNFKNYVNIFNNAYNRAKLTDASNFFEEIKKIIENYMNDYDNIKSNQQNLFSSKTTEYNYYIRLFEEKKFDTLFDNTDDLIRLMSNLGISNQDKWHILKYIAEKNIEMQKEYIGDIDLSQKVYNYIMKYMEGNEIIVGIIKDKIVKEEIDLELIPKTAREIAIKENLDEELVQNVLCAYILNTLYAYYQSAIKKGVTEETIQTLKSLIDTVLSIETHETNNIIKEAQIIVAMNSEIFEKYKEEENINRYTDMSIKELMQENISREEAIELKTLPIVQTISETLDKMETVSKGEKDYEIRCKLLAELILAYNNLIEKKEQEKKKK